MEGGKGKGRRGGGVSVVQSANLAAVWERSMQKLPCVAAASAAEKKKQQKERERWMTQ